MRKTVEIEYVGIEDIQEIMDDAFALIREGHFVKAGLTNYSDNARFELSIRLGGYDAKNEYDYEFAMHMTEDKDDVATMNECKSILKNLLSEV